MRVHALRRNPVASLVAIVAIAGTPFLASCNSPPQRPEPPPALLTSPRTSSAADLLPVPDQLFQATPALAIRTTTTVEVRRGASLVTLRDEKEARRLPSGDFDLLIRRIHEGSEAGDTAESFQAIRVGKDYFTRGSGGQFVHWDDALEEPQRTLEAVAGEPRMILRFLEPCLVVRAVPQGADLVLARPDCRLSSAPESASMTATVREAQGHLRRDKDSPAFLSMIVRLDVSAGGHQASVGLHHEAVFERLSSEAVLRAPADFISSRRDRPVRMVESVLSGLVTDWGPGAPRSLTEARQAAGRPPGPAEATGDSRTGP